MIRIALAILLFNAFFIILIGFLHLIRKPVRAPVDLDSFCAELPRECSIEDPYVLINGKWVCRKDKKGT